MSIFLRDVHRFSADDYEQMCASGALPERGVELLDGFIVESSAKGDRHRWAVDTLADQFVLASRKRYQVSSESLSLQLGPSDEPEPDLALTRRVRDFSQARPRADELALIVEVSDSSLTKDLGIKRERYARAGIIEYWVIDLEHDTLHQFRKPDASSGTYRFEAHLTWHEQASPAEFADVFVRLSEVFGRA